MAKLHVVGEALDMGHHGYGGYGGLGGGYMGGPGMMRSGGGWNYNNRGQTSMFGGQDDWYPSDRYASPCEADMYD